MDKQKATNIVFYLIGLNIVFLILQFLVPVIQETMQGFFLFLGPILILFILGILLTILARQEKQKDRRSHFTIVGLSTASFLIFIVLHNLCYALSTITTNDFVTAVLDLIGAVFFLFATPIAPIVIIIYYLITFRFLRKQK
ncbi:hypothetical protein ACFLZY_01650 [Patescibacteria group bacterium]